MSRREIIEHEVDLLLKKQRKLMNAENSNVSSFKLYNMNGNHQNPTTGGKPNLTKTQSNITKRSSIRAKSEERNKVKLQEHHERFRK